MKKLLKLEFRKLFQMKSLYILSAILIAFSALTIGVYKLTEIMVESADAQAAASVEPIIAGFGEFSSINFLVTALVNIQITIFLAIILSLIFCADYSSGAIKTVVAKGYSHVQIMFSKLIASAVVTVIFTVICWLSSYLLAFVFWNNAGSGWDATLLCNLLVQMLLVLAFCTMFAFIASLVKKTGGVIAISIIAPIAVDLVIGIANVIINKKSFSLSDYWIQGALTNVSNMSASNSTIITGLIVAISYIALFTILNVAFCRKREV